MAAHLVESLVALKAVLMAAWKVVRWVAASAGLLDHQSADPLVDPTVDVRVGQ